MTDGQRANSEMMADKPNEETRKADEVAMLAQESSLATWIAAEINRPKLELEKHVLTYHNSKE